MPDHHADSSRDRRSGRNERDDVLRLVDQALRPVEDPLDWIDEALWPEEHTAGRQDEAMRLIEDVLRPVAADLQAVAEDPGHATRRPRAAAARVAAGPHSEGRPAHPARAAAPGRHLQVGPENPAAADKLLREANRLLEQQEYGRAEPILIRLVKERPRDPEPLASLAVCIAAGRGQFATATKLARRARNLAPRRGCGWFALGYVHLLGSRINEGYRFLEEGRRRDPRDPRLRWGLDGWEQRRTDAIVGRRPGPLARLVTSARLVLTNRRVVLAGAVYVFYRAAFLFAQAG